MLRQTPGWPDMWLLLAVPSLAQQMPRSLHGWKEGVLHDVPQYDGPFLANQMPDADTYGCSWSSDMGLVAGRHVDRPAAPWFRRLHPRRQWRKRESKPATPPPPAPSVSSGNLPNA